MPISLAVSPSMSEVLSVTILTVMTTFRESLHHGRLRHAIANPWLCEDVRGACGVVPQLVPHLLDVLAHNPCVAGIERPPDPSQYLFVGQHAAGGRRELGEQFVLGRGEGGPDGRRLSPCAPRSRC